MSRKPILTTVALTAISIFLAPIAAAQDAKLYSNRTSSLTSLKHSLDCSISEKVSRKVFAGIKRSKNVTDDKREKFAIKAAVRAIESGFNYAIMDPVTLTERADYQDVVRYGWGTARRDTVTTARYLSYYQACQIVDDELAFDIMFNPETKARFSQTGGLVDLRQFVKALGGGSDLSNIGPAQLVLSPKRFELAGDRERLMSQHPVKTEAMKCLTDFSSVSLHNFRSIPTQNTTCLDKLRGKASAVGWEKFPLFLTDETAAKGNRGYTVRGSSSGAATTQSSKFKLTEGWEDVSAEFPGFDGSVLVYKNSIFHIGSNTATEDDMLDIGVFLIAKEKLRTGTSLLTVERHTDNVQLRYQSQYDKELKKAKLNAKRLKLAEPTTLPKYAVSESNDLWKPGRNRLEYRILETYENILVVGSQSYVCTEEDIVCADKLEAYNTLGPKLVGPSFQPVSAPSRYRPYKP